MVGFGRYLFVLALAACSPGPCPLDDLVDCDACTVRHAYELSTNNPLVFAGGGGTQAVCGTCGAVWSLDTKRELATIDLGPRSEILQVSGAPDGTFYVVADQSAVPAGDDDIDSPGPTNRTLIALDPQHQVRWQRPLDPHLDVFAAPSGVFVANGNLGAYSSVTALDTTGAPSWTLQLDGASLGSDGAGGLWVGGQGFDNQGGVPSAPLRHIGADGTVVGTTEIVAWPAAGDFQTWVFFLSVSASPDGGVVAAFEVEGSQIVIAGTTTMSLPTMPSDHHRVIAAFDAAGAVKWAHLADEVGSVAATASGAVALGGFTGGLSGTPVGDLLVETWDASGLTGTVRVGGAGSQRPDGPIAVTDDGGAWITFYNSKADDGDSTELSFNDDTFDGGSHTYLVEVSAQAAP